MGAWACGEMASTPIRGMRRTSASVMGPSARLLSVCSDGAASNLVNTTCVATSTKKLMIDMMTGALLGITRVIAVSNFIPATASILLATHAADA